MHEGKNQDMPGTEINEEPWISTGTLKVAFEGILNFWIEKFLYCKPFCFEDNKSIVILQNTLPAVKLLLL